MPPCALCASAARAFEHACIARHVVYVRVHLARREFACAADGAARTSPNHGAGGCTKGQHHSGEKAQGRGKSGLAHRGVLG